MRALALIATALALSSAPGADAGTACADAGEGLPVKIYRAKKDLPSHVRAVLDPVDLSKEAVAGPDVCKSCTVQLAAPERLDRCGDTVVITPQLEVLPCPPCQGVAHAPPVPEAAMGHVRLYRVPRDAKAARLINRPVVHSECPPCMAP